MKKINTAEARYARFAKALNAVCIREIELGCGSVCYNYTHCIADYGEPDPDEWDEADISDIMPAINAATSWQQLDRLAADLRDEFETYGEV